VIVDCKAETLLPFEATFFVCVGCMHMSIADIPQYISVWEASTAVASVALLQALYPDESADKLADGAAQHCRLGTKPVGRSIYCAVYCGKVQLVAAVIAILKSARPWRKAPVVLTSFYHSMVAAD
jgi:hypothetical protein